MAYSRQCVEFLGGRFRVVHGNVVDTALDAICFPVSPATVRRKPMLAFSLQETDHQAILDKSSALDTQLDVTRILQAHQRNAAARVDPGHVHKVELNGYFGDVGFLFLLGILGSDHTYDRIGHPATVQEILTNKLQNSLSLAVNILNTRGICSIAVPAIFAEDQRFSLGSYGSTMAAYHVLSHPIQDSDCALDEVELCIADYNQYNSTVSQLKIMLN